MSFSPTATQMQQSKSEARSMQIQTVTHFMKKHLTQAFWGMKDFLLSYEIKEDCAIFYSECNYQGQSYEVCNNIPSFIDVYTWFDSYWQGESHVSCEINPASKQHGDHRFRWFAIQGETSQVYQQSIVHTRLRILFRANWGKTRMEGGATQFQENQEIMNWMLWNQ